MQASTDVNVLWSIYLSTADAVACRIELTVAVAVTGLIAEWVTNVAISRSTPKSRPNNMGKMSVRPQKVFPIPMKFGM